MDSRAIVAQKKDIQTQLAEKRYEMIIDHVFEDIFLAPQKHIAFAINIQGCNDAGFAGQVSSRIWPELTDTGGNELGDILTHKNADKIYYALVCWSLDPGGWDATPRVVRECFDKIEIPDDEEIAVVLMGSGPVGMMPGADVDDILKEMDLSTKKLIIYKRELPLLVLRAPHKQLHVEPFLYLLFISRENIRDQKQKGI